MNDQVFILCAGAQQRWPEGKPKQLLDVAGESILARQIRQIKARGGIPFVITGSSEIGNAAQICGGQWFYPMAHRWLVETIMDTRPYWEGRQTFFLGDVIFSKAVMDQIFQCDLSDSPVKVFGTAAECFAFIVAPEAYERVKEAAKIVLSDAVRYDPSVKGHGQLWNLYRRLEGLPLNSHKIGQHSKIFQRVTDWTNDIDTAMDYLGFCETVLNGGLLDDRPEK